MKINYNNYHRDSDYAQSESLFRNIFEKRFNLISRYVQIPGRVLDIGASNGVMLDIFKEHGWDTYGVEPSGNSKIAIQKGHKISKTFFEKTKFKKQYFDAIVLNHTLEHLEKPEIVLKNAYTLLKKGGYILVDVPNAGGIASFLMGQYWPYRLPNEHLSQFTKKSLIKIFTNSGFKIVHFESRSGLFEFARPLTELVQSFFQFKKRFFFNIFTLPYAVVATILNSGDSMSLVGKK